MEAVAALSLATNVITVVDFSIKFARKCIDIKKSQSGLHEQFETLESITSQFAAANAELKNSLSDQGCTSSTFAGNVGLLPLAQKCEQDSSILLAKIAEAKGDGGKGWHKAFVSALKSYWVKNEVEAIAKRMAEYRSLLDTQILVQLRLRIESVVPEQLQHMNELQSKIENLQSQTEETKQLLADNSCAFDGLSSDHAQILQQQHGLSYQIGQLSLQMGGLNDKQSQTLVDVQSDVVRQRLRNSLWFPELDKRREEIPLAHRQTFSWILDAADRSLKPSQSFLHWLETTDNQLFWMRGKAGSGKSTLMNYVVNDSRTQTALQKWSGPHILTLVDHYFWEKGTELQRSLNGFLRSIIFQILEALPQLTSNAFPSQKENFRTVERSSSAQIAKVWTEKQLLRTLESILQLGVIDRGHICMFVDGLDECDGPSHLLLSTLKRLPSFGNLKLCVSSRPLPEFVVFLQNEPMLKLEDLTHEDIMRYTEEHLREHIVVQDYIHETPNCIKLISETIVEQAQGIFLWVRIVVESLIVGMIYRDDLATLLSSIGQLPRDLEPLYDHMLQRLFSRPQQQSEVAVMFQLVFETHLMETSATNDPLTTDLSGFRHIAKRRPSTFVDLAVAKNIAMSGRTGNTSGLADLSKLVKDAENRILFLGGGFVEISDSPKMVRFFHRTAVDFLSQPAVWARIVEPTSSYNFDPVKMLLLAQKHLVATEIDLLPKHLDLMDGLTKRLHNYRTVGLRELMNIMLQLLPQDQRNQETRSKIAKQIELFASGRLGKPTAGLYERVNGVGLFLQCRYSNDTNNIAVLDQERRASLDDMTLVIVLTILLCYFDQDGVRSPIRNKHKENIYSAIILRQNSYSWIDQDITRLAFQDVETPYVTALKLFLRDEVDIDVNAYQSGWGRDSPFGGSTLLYDFKKLHDPSAIGFEEIVEAFEQKGARAEGWWAKGEDEKQWVYL